MRRNPIAGAAGLVTRMAQSKAAKDQAGRRHEALANLKAQMDRDQDTALKKAVEAFLGHEVTDPAPLIGRLAHAEVKDEPGAKVFLVDGTPVLWVGPDVVKVVGNELHAVRPMRQLVEAAPKLIIAP